MPRTVKLAVIAGDGIGPEVTAEALKVLRAVPSGIEFHVTGPTNQMILIEATSDLISSQWTPISTNQVDSGLAIFQEKRAVSVRQRFYRARF